MKELFFCPSCMAKLTPEDEKCPICGSELNMIKNGVKRNAEALYAPDDN